MNNHELRVLTLVRDLEKKLQQLGTSGWQDIDTLAQELSSYCECCLNVCQEFLSSGEFAHL